MIKASIIISQNLSITFSGNKLFKKKGNSNSALNSISVLKINYKDLTMQNLWENTSKEIGNFSDCPDNQIVDLAIIGWGFTGCSAALEAARQGASVALLESEKIGFGGSGRNVGLVNAGLWLPPKKIKYQFMK